MYQFAQFWIHQSSAQMMTTTCMIPPVSPPSSQRVTSRPAHVKTVWGWKEGKLCIEGFVYLENKTKGRAVYITDSKGGGQYLWGKLYCDKVGRVSFFPSYSEWKETKHPQLLMEFPSVYDVHSWYSLKDSIVYCSAVADTPHKVL